MRWGWVGLISQQFILYYLDPGRGGDVLDRPPHQPGLFLDDPFIHRDFCPQPGGFLCPDQRQVVEEAPNRPVRPVKPGLQGVKLVPRVPELLLGPEELLLCGLGPVQQLLGLLEVQVDALGQHRLPPLRALVQALLGPQPKGPSEDKAAGGGEGEDEGGEGRKRHGLGVPVVSKKVVRPCRGDRFSLVLAGQRSKSTGFLCNRVEGLAQVLAPI
mmetsp:Transcript_10627/g.36750  ORF Transcript_10627/g.36750 Transcript_10627/m.36750 type:complete len:214 (-) Transcript_10627:341-982(-)